MQNQQDVQAAGALLGRDTQYHPLFSLTGRVAGAAERLSIEIKNGQQKLTGVTLTDWFTQDGTQAGVDG